MARITAVDLVADETGVYSNGLKLTDVEARAFALHILHCVGANISAQERQEERAAIAAYLRHSADAWLALGSDERSEALLEAAREIESGEHHKENE